MLYIALFTMSAFVITWLVFSIVAYGLIYGSLIFAYVFVWDEKTRKEICPKGLIRTILFDE